MPAWLIFMSGFFVGCVVMFFAICLYAFDDMPEIPDDHFRNEAKRYR